MLLRSSTPDPGRVDLLRLRTALAGAGPVATSLLIAVALWTLGVAGGIRWREMTDLGFVSVLPLVCLVALAVLSIGMALAATTPRLSPWWWRAHVVALVLAIHATPALVYGTLRTAWAWKHIGIVDFISRNGVVDPTVESLAVYHGWPGFFSLIAMVADGAGVEDVAALARWWPAAINLLVVAVLLVLVRALTDDVRVHAASCWVYVLGSWVGQDYFSPQSLVLPMYLAVVAILLHVMPMRRPASSTGTRSVGAAARRLLPLVRGSSARLARMVGRALPRRGRPLRVATPPALFLLAAATISSHQLTPVMVVVGVAALLVSGYAGTVWQVLVLAAAAVGWALLFARPLVLDNAGDLAEVGSVGANLGGTLNDLAVVSAGQAAVSLTARALTGAVLVLAAAGVLRSWRRGFWPGVALGLTAAPVALVGFSAYGGEILFRVYLFALPTAAVLVALLLVADRSRAAAVCALLAVTAVLLPASLVATLGNERLYAFSEEEVQLVRHLQRIAPEGSLLIEGTRNYPTQSLRYDAFTYVPISREPVATRARIVDDPVAELGEWMDDPRWTATYLLLTRSMAIDAEVLGVMPPGGIAAIDAALAASDEYIELQRNGDGVVYVRSGRLPQPTADEGEAIP